MKMEDGIRELHARREKAKEHGGAKQVEMQRARGRLTARERVDKLLDPETFWEIGILNLAENPDLHDRESTAADARVVGFGDIDKRKVFVAAEDRTVLGGSDGLVGTWRKHMCAEEWVAKKGYPSIYLGDNLGGLRLPDGMGSYGWARFVFPYSMYKFPREAPRVGAIMGECFGDPSWMASMSDFVVMVKGTAMGAAGPRVLKIAIGEDITPWELGSLDLRYYQTGEVDAIAENDEECMAIIREFLSYMPSHNGEEPPVLPTQDPITRRIDDAGKVVPDDLNRGYDMHLLIKRIVDDGKYFKIKAGFGKSLITCLGRIGGRVVGIIANNPFYDAGAPSVQSCEKAQSFICLCDSFNIPLVFLTDVPGMFPGSFSEKQKLPGKIMNWIEAESLATVPKVSIVLRKAYGIGWNVMCSSKETGDFVVAWPTASMSFVDPEIGVDLVQGAKIAQSSNPTAERERLIEEWNVDSAPWKAAEHHFIDDVIDPRDTRKYIAEALNLCRGMRGSTISEHRLQTWPSTF